MSSFLQFSHLPIELRLRVWFYLLPPPVIQEPRIEYDFHYGERVFAGAINPVLLRVCRESRSVALEYYTLAFPQSYVDFAVDTIYFFASFDWHTDDFDLLEHRVEPCHRARICHLAIDCQTWNHSAGGDHEKVAEVVLIEKLKAYPNVQTLTLVLRMPGCEPGWGGHLQFVEETPLGPWYRTCLLQEFLLSTKWGIPASRTDKEMLDMFEKEQQDVADQIQRLQLKYPDKKFPEIKWRFLKFGGGHFNSYE